MWSEIMWYRRQNGVRVVLGAPTDSRSERSGERAKRTTTYYLTYLTTLALLVLRSEYRYKRLKLLTCKLLVQVSP